MGTGIVYSRHNEPQMLIKRGVSLLLLGYLLNFLRSGIPEIILHFIDPSLALFGIPVSIYCVDILQFAGSAMILLGIFKKQRVEPVYLVMLGLLMAGLGDILAWVSTGHEYADAVLDLIWGANEWAFFPLLNWFIYPAAGVCFGEVLIHCNDKDALYRRLFPIGLIGVTLSYYLIFTQGDNYYSGEYYYFMGIKNVIYGLCYPMLLFSVCHFLSVKTGLKDNRFVLYSSRNLNTLYCISWLLIFYPLYFGVILNGWDVSGVTFYLLMAAVFAASYGLCQVQLQVKKHFAR